MIKPNLSITIATHNEEANIGKCLESIKDIANEIIIVDGQSTDNTIKIAKKYKARIISTTNPPNFHINKKVANDTAIGDWILQLDADEIVTPELSREIISAITKISNINGFWMPRLNYFLGRFLTKGGQYPDYTLRLYRKNKGNLPAKDVHEQAVVDGPTAYLTHDLLHYGTPDFESYLLRFNKYTSLIAFQLKEQKVSINIPQTINYLTLKPFLELTSLYLRHRGYVDGFPGFVFALFSGLRFAVAYIKYWQITKYPA